MLRFFSSIMGETGRALVASGVTVGIVYVAEKVTQIGQSPEKAKEPSPEKVVSFSKG